MSELKPCPFCGGEVKLVHDADMMHFVIACDNHDWGRPHEAPDKVAADVLMVSWGDNDEDKRALVEAWNTRWERTCHMNYASLYDEEGADGIECDECGWSDLHDPSDPLPARCPGCGAKVVVV